MSLFDFEIPHVQGLILDPAKQVPGTGSGGIAAGVPNGTIWFDVNNALYTLSPAGTVASGFNIALPAITTAVTNVNPTSATNLMTYVFPAGSLNTLGRVITIFAAGEVTTGTGTTVTFAITLNDGTNTRTIGTWTTGALTTGQTNLPWEIYFDMVTNTVGTSGKMFAHGSYTIPLTAPTAAASEYLDQNTAASSTLNLTLSNTLAVNSLFGSTNGSNSVTQDLMIMEVGL